ncbi:MAG TPA: hypothetical protein VGI03_12240 [Verrucomicrobiae bacterium]|jgi:hypothetical protein
MFNYWQIAAGSAGREYSDEFIRFGLAFVGGDTQIETMTRVQPGDRVLLKRGLSEIRAVGVVVTRDSKHNGCGDKDWLRDFEGWDLQAYCYVEWHVPPNPLSVSGLTRATIQSTWKADIIEVAEKILKEHPASSVEAEPKPTNRVDDEHIVEFLIGEGLRIAAAEELTTTFRRIRRLANYYYNYPAKWEDIREHETRTFLIVPLLLALGWPEQAIKIEQPTNGGRVDLALFDGPFDGNPSECIALIETKGFAQGLSYAPEQVRNYAQYFPKCRVIFVSNGYCYKAYLRAKGGFPPEPSAYLNIRDPRDAYPLNPKTPGALDVLRLLLKTH